MSRYSLDSFRKNTEVSIGWDPELQTFFCSVIDFELGAGAESSPSIWLGASPDNAYLEPEPLIDIITPYACSFDRNLLISMLNEDKQTNSEKIYDFDDDEEDEDEE